MRALQQSAAMPSPASSDANPIHLLPGNSIRCKAGDQTTSLPAPTTTASDREIPASAGSDEATDPLISTTGMSRHETISNGQPACVTQTTPAIAGDDLAHPLDETPGTGSQIIAEIQALVRMRRRWQKAETALILQGKALCRSWTAGDKDEANRIHDLATKGEVDDPALIMALAPFLDAKARFETERKAIEKTLRKLSRTLPIWKAWVEGVRGFGDLRLAVIVGECGDISAYRNPSCLWKRMGLAVIGGQRQRRVSDADEALEHGYNPERRAIAYVMSTELIKAQIRNVKDDGGKRTDQSVAIGPYGQLYLDRKSCEIGREGITRAHANHRAARYMVKRVLRDLFVQWKRVSSAVEENGPAEAATSPSLGSSNPDQGNHYEHENP